MHLHTPVLVVVALVVQHGKVLVGRRPAQARDGGAWEFPGGKIEFGETFESALTRELREELSIEASTIYLVHRSINTFDDGGTFDVRYAIVSNFLGEPQALVHEELLWIEPAKLKNINMISGNEEVVELLCAGAWNSLVNGEWGVGNAKV